MSPNSRAPLKLFRGPGDQVGRNRGEGRVERGDSCERIELVELVALLKHPRGHQMNILGQNAC